MLILSAGCLLVLTELSPQGSRPESDLEPKRESSLRVMLGGDIFVGPRMKSRFKREGIRSYVRPIADITDQADLHLANLEAPITNKTETSVRKRFLLRNPPSYALDLLEEMNVDGVSLANNHILDYGGKGLLETMQYLNQSAIRFTGAGASDRWAERPVYFEKKGKKIALLAFSNTFPRSFWADRNSYGTAYGSPERIRKQVQLASQHADYTLVSFHWGSELDTRPKEYQRRFARLAVRSGADVVFGHHPHSIQPYEQYRDGLIFYSLGNYFFTTLSDDVQYGLLADLTFNKDERPSVRFHVLNINNYDVNYRPRVALSFKDAPTLAQFFMRPKFHEVATLPEDIQDAN